MVKRSCFRDVCDGRVGARLLGTAGDVRDLLAEARECVWFPV